MEKLTQTAYLAASGFEEQLRNELSHITAVYNGLFFAEGPPQNAFWSQNIWFDPLRIPIQSIGDAARQLKNLGRNWALHPYTLHRRAELIQQSLPSLGKKPLTFPTQLPQTPMGGWMLLDENTVIASPRCSSPFPNGIPHFNESKSGPPGRAYLKLWEILTLIKKWPLAGEKCLELGASPGGWTWALAQLGSSITAVDRALLDPEVMRFENVHFQKRDAFSIQPADFEGLDWLFSDLICYPEKLYAWLQPWLDSGKCSNFVCTLKFQGETHYSAIEKFAAIPGSSLYHLYHNKHELTWVKMKGE